MTVLARAQRGIDLAAAGDREALRDFHIRHFGADSLPARPEYQRWAYGGISGTEPRTWICRRDGAIVGQQCGIPVTLSTPAGDVPASWAVDLMVAPEWRLRGVGPALSERHAVSEPVALALGMTDAAYGTYRRLGWSDLGAVPTWIRPLDLPRCLKVSPFNGPLLTLAARAGQPPMTALAVTTGMIARMGGLTLAELPAFDERAEPLWEAAHHRHAVQVRRDFAFLRWRFDRGAGRESGLRRFYALRRGAAMAYVVLRVDPWNGLPVAVVIDALARPGWFSRTMALVVAMARREGLAAVTYRMMSATDARALGGLGFLCLKRGLRSPTRVMVRVGEAEAGLRPLLTDPRNWRITPADSDIGFRPLGT